MFISRTLGWFMIAIAITIASAEAVMAISSNGYEVLEAGHIWVLISGEMPNANSHSFYSQLGGIISELPAWAVLGMIGFVLAYTCRYRPPSGRLFPPSL